VQRQRKSDHIRINLEADVDASGVSSGWERYRLPHCALPELDLAAVDPATELLGKRLALPLLISSMTGGTPEAWEINRRLALGAEAAQVGLGLGSLRAALEDRSLAYTYQVRPLAPHVLLLANLGAVQLNYGLGPDQCRRAVELVEADGLILHLNPLQEALQPEGQTHFSGLLARIEAVCRALEVPVIVKEVGGGLSEQVARQLAAAGVAALDVAGAGGTSWSQVEMHRARSAGQRAVAAAFAGWGIPSAESLRLALRGAPGCPVIASGGIRTGLEMAITLAMGAAACGVARPFLHAAHESEEKVNELIGVLGAQLRTAMFAAGARDLAALRRIPLAAAGEPVGTAQPSRAGWRGRW
jgi:isopentenyl-diphosphate delta-isomerase